MAAERDPLDPSGNKDQDADATASKTQLSQPDEKQHPLRQPPDALDISVVMLGVDIINFLRLDRYCRNHVKTRHVDHYFFLKAIVTDFKRTPSSLNVFLHAHKSPQEAYRFLVNDQITPLQRRILFGCTMGHAAIAHPLSLNLLQGRAQLKRKPHLLALANLLANDADPTKAVRDLEMLPTKFQALVYGLGVDAKSVLTLKETQLKFITENRRSLQSFLKDFVAMLLNHPECEDPISLRMIFALMRSKKLSAEDAYASQSGMSFFEKQNKLKVLNPPGQELEALRTGLGIDTFVATGQVPGPLLRLMLAGIRGMGDLQLQPDHDIDDDEDDEEHKNNSASSPSPSHPGSAAVTVNGATAADEGPDLRAEFAAPLGMPPLSADLGRASRAFGFGPRSPSAAAPSSGPRALDDDDEEREGRHALSDDFDSFDAPSQHASSSHHEERKRKGFDLLFPDGRDADLDHEKKHSLATPTFSPKPASSSVSLAAAPSRAEVKDMTSPEHWLQAIVADFGYGSPAPVEAFLSERKMSSAHAYQFHVNDNLTPLQNKILFGCEFGHIAIQYPFSLNLLKARANLKNQGHLLALVKRVQKGADAAKTICDLETLPTANQALVYGHGIDAKSVLTLKEAQLQFIAETKFTVLPFLKDFVAMLLNHLDCEDPISLKMIVGLMESEQLRAEEAYARQYEMSQTEKESKLKTLDPPQQAAVTAIHLGGGRLVFLRPQLRDSLLEGLGALLAGMRDMTGPQPQHHAADDADDHEHKTSSAFSQSHSGSAAVVADDDDHIQERKRHSRNSSFDLDLDLSLADFAPPNSSSHHNSQPPQERQLFGSSAHAFRRLSDASDQDEKERPSLSIQVPDPEMPDLELVHDSHTSPSHRDPEPLQERKLPASDSQSSTPTSSLPGTLNPALRPFAAGGSASPAAPLPLSVAVDRGRSPVGATAKKKETSCWDSFLKAICCCTTKKKAKRKLLPTSEPRSEMSRNRNGMAP